MQLTVLGSNGTFATAGRPASGYLITHVGTTLWMDAGFGTFMELAAQTDPQNLDAVLLSHRHPDHCSDFLALFHFFAYGSQPRSAPLPVIVPDKLADHLGDFLGGSRERMNQIFDFRTVGEGDRVQIEQMEISIAMASHPPPTLSPRIEAGGKVLTYTADTGPSATRETHAEGSDLLLAEATLTSRSGNDFPFHMTGSEAGAMAARAGVRKLMLTHISPNVDPTRSLADAEEEFDGDVMIAVPGSRVSV